MRIELMRTGRLEIIGIDDDGFPRGTRRISGVRVPGIRLEASAADSVEIRLPR
jgi:hypothetical protein